MGSDYAPIEYEFSNEYVVLDPFTCDLNLAVDKECLLAYPLSGEGFSSMWAGCRATYGTYDTKTVFEVHLEDHCDNTFIPKDDPDPYLLRVGWSLNDTSLQLGEDAYSFAYCSNGKKCCNKVFEDYGEVFQKGDSIAAYFHFDDKNENILISFSKNGLDLGTAFKISKNEICKYVDERKSNQTIQQESENQPKYIFYPHVLSKNYVYEMNFGQRVSFIGDEPFAPIKSDFKFIQKLPYENRYFNGTKLLDKKECDVIFLIGLPGSGKTHWAREYVKRNPKMSYSIIGFSSVLEKLRVLGVKKKPSSSSTDSSSIYTSGSKIQADLLEKVLKCMNILMEIAVQSNRNVIIDQPNVYKSARRRKLKYFEGYGSKRAIVIVSNDEEFKQRVKMSEQEDGKEIPISLLNDMKGNFILPDDNEFDSIEYVALPKEEAQKLIEIYNKDGVTDRFNAYVAKRNKISDEKREINIAKMGTLNANLLRPGIRPGVNMAFSQMGPTAMYGPPQMTNRFNRYPFPPGQPNIRRPYNYPNQMPRPGVPIDFLNASFPPSHMGAYIGIPPPALNIAQPGQHPYYIQAQPQNNWAPAMPLSGYQPAMPQYILPTIQPYHIHQPNHQFNQPTISTNESNNWNPALSTNVTNLISSSTNSSSFYNTTNTSNPSNESQK